MDGPRLEDTGRGLTIFASERYLYSKRNPSGRPERIARELIPEEKCLYVVPSPLLGYGLSILADRIPSDSHILALESSQELMKLCAPHIEEKLLKHTSITWTRLSDRTSLHSLLTEMGHWNFRRIRRIDLTGVPRNSETLYDELTAFLSEDIASYWRNRHALGRLGRDWVRHTYANVAAIASGNGNIQPLDNIEIIGIPIVIGAGPSLEHNLSFLARNREKFWILTTDSAIPSLLDSGIRPDAIVALETQAWNLLDFHGLKNSGIPVLADLTSYPPGFSFTGGPLFLFSSSFADLNFLDRLENRGLRARTIPPLGSVGVAAVEIVLSLNVGPVFLAGLDFAYRPGKSHARGTAFHRWQCSVSRRTDPVPGWESAMLRPRLKGKDARGKARDTDAVLEGYASLLKDRYAASGRLLILGEGGLDLGAPVMSHEEAEIFLMRDSAVPTRKNSTVERNWSDSALRAGAFLKEEKSCLERVVEAWDSYARGEGSALEVSDSLVNLDQVFCDFPDSPPLPRPEDSFLVRAVSRVRNLIRYIDRTST